MRIKTINYVHYFVNDCMDVYSFLSTKKAASRKEKRLLIRVIWL